MFDIKEFELFSKEKEKLLNETFHFKNKYIPIIQAFDEQNPFYSFGEIRRDKKKMLDQQLSNIAKTLKIKTDFNPYLEPWHCM